MVKIYAAHSEFCRCPTYGLWLSLVFFLSHSLVAQSPRTLTAFAELGGYASSARQTPFWLRANQQGIVPLQSPIGTLRLGTRLDYRRPSPDSVTRLDWGGGLEGVVNQGAVNQLLLPEAYAKVRYGRLELWAGRRREVMGILDTLLTSGGWSWSGNALPIPKVQLGLSEYYPLRFLNNFVALKGFYAHGWFNAPYIQHAFLHQKALFGRFGHPRWRVSLHLGITHHVQWGGKADYLKTLPYAVNGQLTTAFSDYITGVVLGKISADRQNPRYAPFDGENRIGNHVGNYDMALDIRLNNASVLVYRQHPFEDTSGLLMLNFPDGLHGIRWRKSTDSPVASSPTLFSLRSVLVEWLHTQNQAGETFDITGSRFKGGDNYFNHAQYVRGWSYFDRGIGTPFVQYSSELKEAIGGRGTYFFNNRVNMYHLGLEGLLAGRAIVRAKFSYSQNSGTFGIPFSQTLTQFSSLLSIQTPLSWLGGAQLSGQVAYDQGELIPKAFGVYVGLRKEWKTKGF